MTTKHHTWLDELRAGGLTVGHAPTETTSMA